MMKQHSREMSAMGVSNDAHRPTDRQDDDDDKPRATT